MSRRPSGDIASRRSHGGTTGESQSMRHRAERASVGGSHTAAAIVAVAAIAAGIIVYNNPRSPTGPLPVHLPARVRLLPGVYTPRAPLPHTPG